MCTCARAHAHTSMQFSNPWGNSGQGYLARLPQLLPAWQSYHGGIFSSSARAREENSAPWQEAVCLNNSIPHPHLLSELVFLGADTLFVHTILQLSHMPLSLSLLREKRVYYLIVTFLRQQAERREEHVCEEVLEYRPITELVLLTFVE